MARLAVSELWTESSRFPTLSAIAAEPELDKISVHRIHHSVYTRWIALCPCENDSLLVLKLSDLSRSAFPASIFVRALYEYWSLIANCGAGAVAADFAIIDEQRILQIFVQPAGALTLDAHFRTGPDPEALALLWDLATRTLSYPGQTIGLDIKPENFLVSSSGLDCIDAAPPLLVSGQYHITTELESLLSSTDGAQDAARFLTFAFFDEGGLAFRFLVGAARLGPRSFHAARNLLRQERSASVSRLLEAAAGAHDSGRARVALTRYEQRAADYLRLADRIIACVVANGTCQASKTLDHLAIQRDLVALPTAGFCTACASPIARFPHDDRQAYGSTTSTGLSRSV
jgi:hypothetical protein